MPYSTGKFREGQQYYWYWPSNFEEPTISTWCYAGFHETPGCSSTSCDVPFHFHVFAACRGECEPAYRLRFPSLASAERQFLTWEELSVAIAKWNSGEREKYRIDPDENWTVAPEWKPKM